MIVNATLTIMDTLDGLKTVVAVVETGSFTAASERLGLSKALVSKYVGEVEQQLGVRLFNRSTRKLALTEAGQNYYESALSLIDHYNALVDGVCGEQSSPRGLLRVSAPQTFGEMKLAPLLPQFLDEYSDMQVDLLLGDRPVDMLEEGIDVRILLGGVDDSSMVARAINTQPLVLCASPDYLKSKGQIKTPAALAAHTCVIDSNFRIGKKWPLLSPKGESFTVEVKSRAAANSPRAVKEIVLAGGGVGMIPYFIVEQELDSGDLIQILPKYKTLEFGLFAVYPHRRYLSKKARCFVDFMVEAFGDA